MLRYLKGRVVSSHSSLPRFMADKRKRASHLFLTRYQAFKGQEVIGVQEGCGGKGAVTTAEVSSGFGGVGRIMPRHKRTFELLEFMHLDSSCMRMTRNGQDEAYTPLQRY